MSATPGEGWGAFWKRLFGIGGAAPEPGRAGGTDPEDEYAPDPDFEPYVVTDELDLHGFYPEQVPEVVDEFIRNAVRLKIEEVRIAHGKGRSVMKREVWKVLEASPLVREFREAPPQRGGWGATLAWLDSSDSSEQGEES